MNPINDLKTKIKSKPVGEKFLSDSHFRAMTIALLSMGCNILYSVLYGVMAYIYSSFWFLTLFAYYLILGLYSGFCAFPLPCLAEAEKTSNGR